MWQRYHFWQGDKWNVDKSWGVHGFKQAGWLTSAKRERKLHHTSQLDWIAYHHIFYSPLSSSEINPWPLNRLATKEGRKSCALFLTHFKPKKSSTFLLMDATMPHQHQNMMSEQCWLQSQMVLHSFLKYHIFVHSHYLLLGSFFYVLTVQQVSVNSVSQDGEHVSVLLCMLNEQAVLQYVSEKHQSERCGPVTTGIWLITVTETVVRGLSSTACGAMSS